MSKLFGSFYARVLGVFLITGFFLLLVIVFTWRWVVHEGDQHPLRPVAINHMRYMVEDIGVPPDLEKAREITEQIPLRIAIRGPALVWDSDPRFIDFPELPEWRNADHPRILRHEGHHFALYPQGDYRFYISWRHRFLQPRDKVKLLVGLLLVSGVFWLSYLATQRLLRPVRSVSTAATRIKEGDLDYRVEQHYGGELGDLCRNLNDMADSLQELLEAKRQMLLAISHELRSPITRAKVNSEFIGEEKTRARIVADLNEMDALVGTLIESERLNQPHVALNRELVNINALVEKVVALFPEKSFNLNLDSQQSVASIDPVRMELLLRNVISNAVRYGKGKPVTVTLDRQNQHWRLVIRDRGDGIPQEHLARLGDPFYRPDDSRRRQTGGVGLGLYLARRIIEAHGGTMEIHSLTEGGDRRPESAPESAMASEASESASGTTIIFSWQEPE